MNNDVYVYASDSCPNCGATAGEWCQRPPGHYRPMPCIARLRKNPGASNDAPVTGQDGKTYNQATDETHSSQAVRDFSEPLHREEA